MKKAITVLLSAALLFLFGCSRNQEPEQEQVPALSPCGETALFLAGEPLPETSPLFSISKKQFYIDYAAELNEQWNRFQKPNLEKMREWAAKHQPERTEKNILYPFSGPDIMNVLTFFPDGETYTMFGLEDPGLIPSPAGKTDEEIQNGLTGIRLSLESILNMNFFQTKKMKKQLGIESFNSITGLMMIFLAKEGYRVEDVRKIAINRNVETVPWEAGDDLIDWDKPPVSGRIPGVEIDFSKDGKTRTLRFFMLNVIDYALKTWSPHFLKYLEAGKPYCTFIKSASYLMHNDKNKFTLIRKAVLNCSSVIVQDDSGIPLRYISGSIWNNSFHGVYDRPIRLFRNRMQKDLKLAFKKKSTGKLPFSYGYDHKEGRSNLIISVKK